MSDTTSRLPSLRALVRHPRATLRPTATITAAAERCASVLRHPRSRIRATAHWQAPHLRFTLPSGTVTTFLSQRSASPALQQRLQPRLRDDHTAVRDDGPAHPHQLVTLSALASPTEMTGSVEDMTADLTTLVHHTVGAEPPWLSVERAGDPWSDGCLEWTWHALIPTQLHGPPRRRPHAA